MLLLVILFELIMTLKANYEISEIDHDKVICIFMVWSSMKMISGLIQKKM